MCSRTATLGVVSVVLLAGCSGFGFDVGQGPFGDGEFPPGVASDDVSEPFTLSEAHVDVLQPTSYSVTETVEFRYANGTLLADETAVTRVAPDETRYLYSSMVRTTAPRLFPRDGNSTLVHYSDGSIVVRKTETATDTSYRTVVDPRREPASPTSVYHGTPLNDERIALLFGQLSNISVIQQDGGIYRIEATSLAGDQLDVNGMPLANATVVEFTATVTTAGLVREYRLSLRGTLHGTDVTVTERVAYAAVGTTTVERPSWYDRAT